MAHYIFAYAPLQRRYWVIYTTFSSASTELRAVISPQGIPGYPWRLFNSASSSRTRRLTAEKIVPKHQIFNDHAGFYAIFENRELLERPDRLELGKRCRIVHHAIAERSAVFIESNQYLPAIGGERVGVERQRHTRFPSDNYLVQTCFDFRLALYNLYSKGCARRRVRVR